MSSFASRYSPGWHEVSSSGAHAAQVALFSPSFIHAHAVRTSSTPAHTHARTADADQRNRRLHTSPVCLRASRAHARSRACERHSSRNKRTKADRRGAAFCDLDRIHSGALIPASHPHAHCRAAIIGSPIPRVSVRLFRGIGTVIAIIGTLIGPRGRGRVHVPSDSTWFSIHDTLAARTEKRWYIFSTSGIALQWRPHTLAVPVVPTIPLRYP